QVSGDGTVSAEDCDLNRGLMPVSATSDVGHAQHRVALQVEEVRVRDDAALVVPDDDAPGPALGVELRFPGCNADRLLSIRCARVGPLSQELRRLAGILQQVAQDGSLAHQAVTGE